MNPCQNSTARSCEASEQSSLAMCEGLRGIRRLVAKYVDAGLIEHRQPTPALVPPDGPLPGMEHSCQSGPIRSCGTIRSLN